jgi:FkbM family methyltransferase
LVGPGGRVFAFEPSTANRRLLEAHLAINRVGNVTVIGAALADAPAELTLSGQDVEGVFNSLREGAGPVGETVPVRRADACLPAVEPGRRLIVKVDTEGFEYRAISGFGAILDRPDLAFVVETTDEWLKQTGFSAVELFALMRDHGLTPYRYDSTGAWSRGVRITPLEGPRSEWQYDTLFARPAVVA